MGQAARRWERAAPRKAVPALVPGDRGVVLLVAVLTGTEAMG